MSNILITSIGNGSYNKDTKKYEYHNAKYKLGDKESNTSYIYYALNEFCNYDKIIIVGTAGSNWNLLYLFACEKNGKEPNNEYAKELDDLFKAENRKNKDTSEIQEFLNTELKAAIGKECEDIIVLRYGLTDKEHITNFELLSEISKHMNDGDKLTFDITHSFRSLAIYELLAVSYIKETLGRQITLDFVSYGMFEIARENDGVTPIVDLSILVKMTDWLKASEEYKRSGTTTLLSELLEDEDNLGLSLEEEEKNALISLGSEIVPTNNLKEFKELVKKCNIIAKDYKKYNIAIRHIFCDLSEKFGDALDDDMLLCLKLSKWHFEKKRYLNSVITLVEATVKYCGELMGRDTDNWKFKEVKEVGNRIRKMTSKNKKINEFSIGYKYICYKRNPLSHGESLSKVDLENLDKSIREFCSLYEDDFKKNKQNIKELRDALENVNAERNVKLETKETEKA